MGIMQNQIHGIFGSGMRFLSKSKRFLKNVKMQTEDNLYAEEFRKGRFQIAITEL